MTTAHTARVSDKTKVSSIKLLADFTKLMRRETDSSIGTAQPTTDAAENLCKLLQPGAARANERWAQGRTYKCNITPQCPAPRSPQLSPHPAADVTLEQLSCKLR